MEVDIEQDISNLLVCSFMCQIQYGAFLLQEKKMDIERKKKKERKQIIKYDRIGKR